MLTADERLPRLASNDPIRRHAECRFARILSAFSSASIVSAYNQIRGRLAAFETRYNAIARPFDWKFTRTDLLRRIDAHDKTKTHALAA